MLINIRRVLARSFLYVSPRNFFNQKLHRDISRGLQKELAVLSM
jgi:hypothetical protein